MAEDIPDNKLVPRKAILFEDKGSYLVTDEDLARLTFNGAMDLQTEFARLVDNNRAYTFDVVSDPKGIRITWEKN